MDRDWRCTMLQLRDIMTTDVVTVTPETTIREAMELLAARHVSGAPVVNERELVGVVTATDLIALAASLSGTPTAHDDDTEWPDDSEPRLDASDIEMDAASAYY